MTKKIQANFEVEKYFIGLMMFVILDILFIMWTSYLSLFSVGFLGGYFISRLLRRRRVE